VVNPQQPQIRSVLASVLAADRQFDEALEQLEEAMRHAPDQPSLLSAAAWILATHPDAEERDPERALEMAERAVELAPRPIAGLFDTLAAAHASAGQFDKAVEAAERGVLIAQNQRDIRTASAIRSRIDLYRKRQPFSEAE
jgi:tetratricopeptide (TPR) repeat protein